MADPRIRENKVYNEEELDANFTKDTYLIKAMSHLIPPNERNLVNKWLHKLRGMQGNMQEKNLRNEYSWFLVLQIESGTLGHPFIQMPSEGPLDPLKKADTDSYNTVLKDADQSAFMYDGGIDNTIKGTAKIKPSNFIYNMAYPSNGFFAYGSCFSNQN